MSSLEARRTSPGRAVNSSTAAKLEEELKRLQQISNLGLGLRVAWVPSPEKALSGEVKGNIIYIYEEDGQKAIEVLRHEVLDHLVSKAIEPYRMVTNELIKLINRDSYKKKEKIVEALCQLFEVKRQEDQG